LPCHAIYGIIPQVEQNFENQKLPDKSGVRLSFQQKVGVERNEDSAVSCSAGHNDLRIKMFCNYLSF
jgi:hypothetical protein